MVQNKIYQASGYSQWWSISLILGTEKDCSQIWKAIFSWEKVMSLISVSDQYLRISDIKLFEHVAKPFSFLFFPWVKMTCHIWVISTPCWSKQFIFLNYKSPWMLPPKHMPKEPPPTCLCSSCMRIEWGCFHSPYAVRLLPLKQLLCSSLIKETLYSNICCFSF